MLLCNKELLKEGGKKLTPELHGKKPKASSEVPYLCLQEAGSKSFQAHFSDLSEYATGTFGLQHLLAVIFQDARESVRTGDQYSRPAVQNTGTI